MRAVRYDHFGGIDQLYVADMPDPEAAPGYTVVRVRTTCINPGSLAALNGWRASTRCRGRRRSHRLVTRLAGPRPDRRRSGRTTHSQTGGAVVGCSRFPVRDPDGGSRQREGGGASGGTGACGVGGVRRRRSRRRTTGQARRRDRDRSGQPGQRRPATGPRLGYTTEGFLMPSPGVGANRQPPTHCVLRARRDRR